MAFNFDVEQAAQEAQKRGSTTAKPANSANPVRSAKRISNFSNDDPTAEELAELTKLIHDLAHLEGWSEQELARWMWEREHMTLSNVRKALAALRRAVAEALAPWPTPPATRAKFTLCELVALPKEFLVIEGGKSKSQDQAKRLDSEPEAA